MIFIRLAGLSIRSHGLKPLYRSARTSLIDAQNALFAGSNRFGPHVVTANWPPGRTQRQSSRTPAAISGTKKIPNTHTAASKLSFGNLRESKSPNSNYAFPRPRCAAFARAESKSD